MAKASSKKKPEYSGEGWALHNSDCIEGMWAMPESSVDCAVFSPPFGDLFVYSDSERDLGNAGTGEAFINQYAFFAEALTRVMKPGRIVCVHCTDLPMRKGRDGAIGLQDFSGDLIKAHTNAGLIYHGRTTIWKDPVTAMQRTKALGLLHKQIRKDATMSRVGIPDNVLVFRKDGERSDPVFHYGSLNEYVNACKENPELKNELEASRILDVETWQQYASPIWMDIDQSDTLNFRQAREEEDEKHLCPLQIGVIKRLLHLYTNPGDVVLTPFMGVGSEVWQSVKMGRKGIGFELKESYYDQAKKNLAPLLIDKTQAELF